MARIAVFHIPAGKQTHTSVLTSVATTFIAVYEPIAGGVQDATAPAVPV
jgi:hypothetical protein